MFSKTQYLWIVTLRVVCVVSFFAVLVALQSPSQFPFDLPMFVPVFTAVWILTAPVAVVSFFRGIRPNFSWLWAPQRSLGTLPILAKISESMNVALPNRVRIANTDKLNAATDGTTLFITKGFEPYLFSRVGESVLAHEFAHVKRRHGIMKLLLAVCLSIPSIQFGVHFASSDALATVMTIFAFLTLYTFFAPLIMREAEYEADALASQTVGLAAMASMFRALVPADQWELEADSHPSTRSRLTRIRRGGSV